MRCWMMNEEKVKSISSEQWTIGLSAISLFLLSNVWQRNIAAYDTEWTRRDGARGKMWQFNLIDHNEYLLYNTRVLTIMATTYTA